jgi:hypothetical protein
MAKTRRITKIKRKGNENGPKLYSEMANRNTVAKIAQLRMGHRGYLHRFGNNESPYCECRYGKETVKHYLRTKKKIEKRGRYRKDENRDSTGRSNKDKTYDGIYQRDGKVTQIRGKTIIARWIRAK